MTLADNDADDDDTDDAVPVRPAPLDDDEPPHHGSAQDWHPTLDPDADIAGPLEDDELLRCRSLWRAVIVQALRDALHVGSCGGSIRALARAWLLNTNRDLEAVCDLAELDVFEVQATARRLIASGATIIPQMRP